MVQLKVYPNTAKIQSQQVFLDLYDTVPIKLTLSIEDITDADATSVFSRTFKIPANAHNSNFFTSAFEINGIDYDVTIKKPAEILVDGQEFRQGHIRLQKIYVNKDLDKTDYELLFLGETRDFSTLIGDAPLCQLNMPDLYVTDSSGTIINPTKEKIAESWQAFPQGNSVDTNGNPNSGLNDGNLLFPLVDFGNTYDEQGELQLPDISIGQNNATDKSFIYPSYPLNPIRMKPMIRAKRLWDQIFSDAGYTYTSDFINSTRFHQMYVSAFGNDARVGYSVEENSNNIFSAENIDDGTGNQAQAFGDFLWLPDNIYDPGGNYTVGVNGGGSYYVAPGDALAGDPNNKYTISAQAYVFGEREISCPGFCTDPVPGRLQLFNLSSGQVIKQSAPGYDNIVGFTFDTEVDNIGIGQGDVLFLRVEPTYSGSTDFDIVHSVQWDVTAAPGSLNPIAQLDCEYKQIDFIKDVLKMFRLVLAPDPAISNNFIVEPWQTYINSGDLHDWSHKLVQNKDQVLEPLFNTQSEEIEYRFQQDEDFVNKFHYDQFKEPYGYLKFDSNNELLKGSRTVETIEIAPTPLGTIYEDIQTNHQVPGFILPLIHANEAEDTGNQRVPIKPKTRFLFYNGLVPVPTQLGTGTQNQWYLGTPGNVNGYSNYPLVSPFENWPQTQQGLNLNFSNDVNYWTNVASTQIFNVNGRTLFDEYWSRYVSSLYGKFSRRLTAYFILNNVDLQTFSFDDTIFVNGVYYRPEKIIDVNIGERTEVKVQLVTANDFKPPVHFDDNLTNFSVTTTDELCGCDGIITVTTDGATPFTWLLSNGQSGQVQTTGGNPQQFDITGICAGSFTLTVTDDLGRSNNAQVTVNPSSLTPLDATFTVTNATNCQNPCNGQVVVTPSGGTAPYTVEWQIGGTGTTRTDLCPGTNLFIVRDANGCVTEPFEYLIECTPSDPVYELNGLDSNCNDTGVIYYAESATLQIGDVVRIQEHTGCYEIHSTTQAQPNVTIIDDYATCADCVADTGTGSSIRLVQCTGIESKRISAATYPNLEVFDVVKLVGYDDCWEVNYFYNDTTLFETVEEVYDTCEECANAQDSRYWLSGCNQPAQTLELTTDVYNQTVEPDPVGQLIGIDTPTYDPNGWFQNTSPYLYSAFYLTKDDGTLRITWTGTAEFANFIPGQIVGNPPLMNGYVFNPATPGSRFGGEYIWPTPDSIWPTEYTTGTFDFSLTYIVDTNQIWVNRGSSAVRTGVSLQPSLYNRYRTNFTTDRDEVAVKWTNNTNSMNIYQVTSAAQSVPPTMSSSGQLDAGNIISVNEAAGCFDIIAQANLVYIDNQYTPDYTYNENGGVYATCADCTGGEIQQTCHDVTATTTPTVFKYTYDDGTGVADQTLTLNSGQSDTICAQLNSVSISTGTGTITDLGTICFKTTWGTSCDPQPPTTKYCYELEGVAGPGTTLSTFEWFEDNVEHSVKLIDGETMTICADDGTPQNVYGQGNITGGTTTCTDIRDCQLCYNYYFEGGKHLDLGFIDCNGNLDYISDVAIAVGSFSGTIPACIAQVMFGTAIPFITATTTCT